MTKPARVIICGSRDWDHYEPIAQTMDGIYGGCSGNVVFIHGAAKGADSIAGQHAEKMGYAVEAYPADWQGKGRGAGPIRNKEMLDTGATLVVAFKEAFDRKLRRGGTEHMVKIARAAGVPTIVHGEAWT